MALASNIQRRGGSAVYYVRLAVPKKLQAIVGKKEIWKSTGVRDPKSARVAALPILAKYRAQFEALSQRQEPTPGDLQAAIWRHYETLLTDDQRQRAAMPTAAMLQEAKDKLAGDIASGAVEWSDDPLVQVSAAADVIAMKGVAAFVREGRTAKLAKLREHLATGETALIEWAADDVIQRDRLLIEKGSPKYRELCQRLQRAEIQALERAAERDAGNWAGVPADPTVAPADPTMGKQKAAAGEGLWELYDRFESEKKASVSLDTWTQNRVIVGLFFEFIGETSHVSAITRKAVRDWKHALASWPVKALKIKEFEGMTFRKIIEANKSVGKPSISENTTNRYLSAIAGFCDWLLNNEYIEQDVIRGMFLSIDKKKQKVFPYSDDQLRVIFESPLMTRCAGDDQEHKPGNVEIRDWRYWLPWIAAYTGARLGELAQLLTADVRQIHGAWCIHVTREGSRLKSTKTSGSQRVIPIHSELIKLGLLDYHAKMVKRGEHQLFPELQPDTRGFFSRTPSRFFAGYFKRIGVKSDKSQNFHSFRHGAADAFRRAGYLDEQFGPLLGHTKATTTGRYGILPQGILSQRVEMIQSVHFAGLPS
ncbi:site-specific integrase [Bradyrhizobium sp. CCBAU 51753]|uniref:site-specific integrase n=1 Tax=Bradyrhizobium sp. CCBAU 51753 TaxID=1325100 RepID=UPI00188A388A|nr:site-specific integrase [Bradyrhizobium sp. CCBAU 51753]QOZ26155.1 integrase [Bradyrhizobium sp. CCBAU 51753]